jgi:hypothetical protein
MLKHVKPVGYGDVLLKAFQVVVAELNDVAASRADHVVMMLAEMSVLITGLTVLEGSLLGETEPAHHLQGLVNKFVGKMDPVFGQQPVHLLGGNVFFRLKEHLEDLEPIFELIDVGLKEEPLEMLFFFQMYRLHNLRGN